MMAPLLLAALVGGVARASDAPSAAPACAAEPPSVVAERLRDFLASGRNEDAVRSVRELEDELACLDAFTTAADLASVYQLAGTAAYYGPRREDAAAWFRRAVVVAPNVPFDGANLGADAARAYEVARGEVAAGAVGGIVALGPVVVDGTAVRAGSTVVLPVGAHLVQEGYDGRIRSSVIAVVGDQTLRVGTPDPALVEARRTLSLRRRGTAFATAGGLALVGGGLTALAAWQRDAWLRTDPETFDSDTEARAAASEAQLASAAAFGGAVLAFTGSVGFAWRGATVKVELFPLTADAASPAGAGAPLDARTGANDR